MLKLININAKFGNFTLKDINLEVQKGEYHVLLGPSGAGKSVLLNIIAGFRQPNSGEIIYKSKNVTNVCTQKREIGLLFQELALFPHMNVFNNVAFPLKVRKQKKEEIKKDVLKYLELTGIVHLKDRNISDLSGGEKQRVAIARCLVCGFDLILLDEPLTAVDVQLRGSLKKLLKKIQALGKTIVHVTHDLKETKVLADKISVIKDGAIISSGTYNEVFSNPDSFFTASFNEAKNYFEVTDTNIIGDKLRLSDNIEFQIDIVSDKLKGVYIKPEKVLLNRFDDKNDVHFTGKVISQSVSKIGIEIEVDAGVTFYSNVNNQEYVKSGIKLNDEVNVSFSKNDIKQITS